MHEATGAEGEVGAPPALDYEKLDGEVKRAIDDLQPEFRTVLLLWGTMEVSYQEIADILGVPIGTVMSRLHRARQALTRTLHDYAREHRLIPVSDQ
jgi:RNA polymerase sigma-70 factor (ECF subfamily)